MTMNDCTLCSMHYNEPGTNKSNKKLKNGEGGNASGNELNLLFYYLQW